VVNETNDEDVGAEELATPKPSRKKAFIAIGAAVVVAGIVFGVILPQLVDWNLVGDAIRGADGWDLALLVFLALIRYWPAGWIYSLVLPGLSVKRGTEAWVATTAVSSTIPGFDLVLRVGMYNSWGFPIERATSGMFLSGLVEMSTKIVLAIGAVTTWALIAADLPLLAVGAIAAAVVIAVGVVIAMVLRNESTARKAGRLVERFLRWGFTKLGRQTPPDIVDRILSVRLEARDVLGERWPKAFLAAFASQAIAYTMLTVSLRAVGVGSDLLDWSQILLVQGLAIILTSIPITPGSVGVSELIYIGFFNLISDGQAPDQIAAGVILFRLAVWLLPIPIGWILTLRWQSKSGQKLFGGGGGDAPTPPESEAATI
jgi:uncharacterized protein (TIRG00374 family)